MDGPHVLRPADVLFGDSIASLEETGEIMSDPKWPLAGRVSRLTTENFEPELVSLELIKHTFSKDTDVLRARNLVRLGRTQLTPEFGYLRNG